MALSDLLKLRQLTKATTKAERDEIFRRRQQVFDLNLSPLGQANRLPPTDEIDPAFFESKGDTKVVRAPIVEPTGTVPEELPPITLSDLEGRAIVSSMSDRSAAGGILTGVEGTPFPYPVNLTGGQDYMFENAPNVWASAEKPSKLIFERAQQAAEMTGETPVLAPFQMGPKGIDFASMTGESMIAQSAAIMPASSKRALNRDIKNFIPDWKGVDDPTSLDQYAAAPKKARDGIRKLISVKYGNEGGAREAQGRISATDPEQLGVEPKTRFLNVGEVDVTGQVDPTGGNVTYPASIPGRGLGRLDTDATLADLLQKEVEAIDAPTPEKQLQQFERSAQLSPRIIPITEELLTDLQGRGFKIQANPVATALGGVMALTAFTPEEAEASLAKLAERGYKIDRNPTSPDPGDESAEFFVYQGDGGPGSKFVGKASMSQNYDRSLSSDDTEIAPDLQGQGIGGEMYDAIQEMTGLEVKPSGYLTEAGARFWVSRDPDQMQKLLDGGYFGGQNADKVEEALEMKRLADEDPGPASVKLRGFGEPKPVERSVFPAPQRFFDPNSKAYKPFTAPFGPTEGGRYLTREGDQFVDITGETVEKANLSVGPDGKASFTVGGKVEKVPATGPGRKIKTNLFKKSAGWNWTEVPEGYDPNPDNSFSLISMYDGKQHYYALETEFPEGVDLARYPKETSEPKLKPTKEKATITLGEKVGEIRTSSGKIHPVYGNAIIRFGAPIVAGAGALGGTEEAEAARFGPIAGFGNKPQQVAEKIVRKKPGPVNSFLNELSKFGVKDEELDAMGIREHFAGRQDVTRQEVIDFINTNPYQIFEDNLVSPTTSFLDYFKIFEPEALRPMQEALARGDREAADKLFAGLRERHTMEMSVNEQPRWANTEYDLVLPGERTNDLEIVLQYPSASAKAKFQQSKLAGQVAKYRERQQDMVDWLESARMLRNSGFDIGDPSLIPNDVKRSIINDPRLSGIFTPEDLADIEVDELDDALDFAFRRVDALTDLPAIDYAIEMDPGLGPVADELNRLRDIVREDSKTAFVNHGHYPNHPNPLLHMRLNQRDVYVQSDDMAVLEGEGTHIDELQSDYHQYARDLGRKTDEGPVYAGPGSQERVAEIVKELPELQQEEDRLYREVSRFRQSGFDAMERAEGKEAALERMRELEGELSQVTAEANALYQEKVKLEEAPPDAPLKDNWYELGLKKALINAVNFDSDFLTMTTGRDQAIRSRQLRTFDKVMVQPNADGTFRIAVSREGTRLNEVNTAPGARIDTELARYLGRDNATEILTDPNTGEVMPFDQFTGFEGKLTGETGGEGMKQYYDKTYVNKLNKMLKRYGGKVETFYVPGKDNSLIPVHGVRLTDEIKEAIRADKDSGSFTAFMHPGAVATAGIGGAAMVAPGGEAEARTVRPEPPALLRRPDADTPPADVPPRAAVAPSPLEQVERFKPKYDLTEVVGGVVTDLVEESGKIVFGAIASIFDPGRDAENKSRLDRVLESEEIFKDGPTYEKFKDGVGEVFDELVVPVVRAGLTTPTAFNPGGAAGISLAQDPTFTEKMPKSSIADQAAAVAELYKHLPEFLREEVLSRVGYAGLAILGALGLRDLGASRKVAGSAMSPIEQSNALPGETVPQLEAPTGVFSNAR